MNRYVRAATAALLVAGGLSSAGCYHRTGVTHGDRARNAYDTSWPDRYNYAARQAVLAPFAQQAATGHHINQTIWNWYFEPGTDKLNAAGLAKIDSLAQAVPADPKVFIQAARDLGTSPENIDKVGALRDDLTARRAAAVHKYLGTQPGRSRPWELAVVDSPTPGVYAPFAADSFLGQRVGFTGTVGGANAVGEIGRQNIQQGGPSNLGVTGTAVGAGAAVNPNAGGAGGTGGSGPAGPRN